MLSNHNLVYISFSVLGPGWEIATLDEENELKFIQEATRDLYSKRNFWIGGSTDVDDGEPILYEDYNLTDCGKTLASFKSTKKL